MCTCNLSICKPVWSPVDPAILCFNVDVIILFVHMSITYYLFTVFCQLPVIGHDIYVIALCIADFDVTMFVCVCFLSPFIASIALHYVHGECFILFSYFIYRIICMSSELIPEILFSCDGCCFDMFAVPSHYVACHCDSDCLGSIVMVVITCTNNCPVGPWSTILLLNCYSRPL